MIDFFKAHLLSNCGDVLFLQGTNLIFCGFSTVVFRVSSCDVFNLACLVKKRFLLQSKVNEALEIPLR